MRSELMSNTRRLATSDPRSRDLGSTVFSSSPAAFATFIADETNKWGKVIRAANIKA